MGSCVDTLSPSCDCYKNACVEKYSGSFCVQQMTGEEQSPDLKGPQMIGDFSVCMQRIMPPHIEYRVRFTFPFLRFLPGTFYKELSGNTLVPVHVYGRRLLQRKCYSSTPFLYSRNLLYKVKKTCISYTLYKTCRVCIK